ncbi:hypothetical protein AYO38_01080 [bacterium SCGC AG-212-C10]|nr:hypothetical protein AYO38_01080 [bacterium SCGC AG-212-C10]
MGQDTLYSRAGGREGISAIVESFYEKVEKDAHMRSIYPADLEPGKAKLKLFFEQWFDGPPVYTELYGHPRLRRRHFPFVIDDRHAGLWLRYMRQSMAENGISNADLGTIFKAFGDLAKHMVNAGEDVPREPLGDVRLT